MVGRWWLERGSGVRVDAYTITFPKSPHGRFLYNRKVNKQLSQHQSFITTFYSYLFLPRVIMFIINMQS